MPRCGFTYSLVAESSAWFLLLWPLLISAPSVGSVADCFLFALRNGVQFSRAEFSNSIPVMFFSHPVTESLPSLCPCQVSAVKYLTLDPIWLERCRSEAGQPRQRNLRHKGWETQCICAAVSWGDLQQGVSFPRALLAHSQIIGGHLENLQNTDNWGKMLDNGSFILFFFSSPVLSYLLLICVVRCFDDQTKIPLKNPRESALVQVNFSWLLQDSFDSPAGLRDFIGLAGITCTN